MYNLYGQKQSTLKQTISQNYRKNESECVNNLLSSIDISEEQEKNIKRLAKQLIIKVRNKRIKGRGIDAIMNEFKLSTDEGIALMSLAESLLRVPDKATQNKLIKDKIAKGDWANYTKTENSFVNAASWGLLITGKLSKYNDNNRLTKILLGAIAKGGEPLIRRAVIVAVQFIGNQFVMGKTIEKALNKARKKEPLGYQFSYDMLGEAALTDKDAMCYMQSYLDAIHAIGKASNGRGVKDGPGISVKLSAIHPRYERAKHDIVVDELFSRIKQLFKVAKHYKMALFIDAEESDRLELSLELLEMLLNDSDIKGFEGIGFVIQSYQKRAPYVIDYIADLAKRSNTRIMVRLVKGAYWDSEIKQAQLDGQIDYPVYTRKFHTDLSYIACTQKLLALQKEIYPLFATHNAYTLALVYELARDKEYEFQCLFGMGETLYDHVVGVNNLNKNCRVYAPVGTYETLLAYLVRRLLENGANSSFVQQLVDKTIPIDSLIQSPIQLTRISNSQPNPNIKNPLNIYTNGRINSRGFDLSDEITLAELQEKLNTYKATNYTAYPLCIKLSEGIIAEAKKIINPADKTDIVGSVVNSQLSDVDIVVNNAVNGFKNWAETPPSDRANILLKMSDLMELHSIELIGLLVREAGKTINNAVNEIREAVDFCRYYANQVKTEFCDKNYTPLGVVVCISPWNFPLAIFMGEISSCLAVGNVVIAKPSAQTNLIAWQAVKLFHQAGVPENALQLMLGSGSIIGNALTKHNQVKGVIFTGSTDTAQLINRNLAQKDFNSVIIAETGGQNAMIVDSTALPEQVVQDVVSSGFDSAGQRCSALRVLYLQADIAEKTINMIKGAMDELIIGNPMDLATDVGPVIDTKSQTTLLNHIQDMRKQARQIYQCKVDHKCDSGIFVPPTIIEIGNINELKQEFFGPIIHIIRFTNTELDKIIAEINSSGYGLTQGIHSRIEQTNKKVYEGINAGNIYVNRNMVGAVVGVQPFGGEGLSGTGPKAGGPLYLYRLVNSNHNPQLGLVKLSTPFKVVNEFLNSLGGFSAEEQLQLANYAKTVTKESLINIKLDLDGPTGEHNFMYFTKRGFIGCFANTKLDYAKQIICALATNNKVILPYNDNTKEFNKISPISFCKSIDDVEEFNAVLISRDYIDIKQLKEQLANRTGLLVVNIIELGNEVRGNYPLYLLTTEKSVSINITATGGNVELINLKDPLEISTEQLCYLNRSDNIIGDDTSANLRKHLA